MIKVLALGDVVSDFGCNCVRKALPKIKRENNIDFTIANGENSAKGNGITPDSAAYLMSCGVDVITTGNHVFRRKEIYDYLDDYSYIVRPANYPPAVPGVGYTEIDLGFTKVAVINLMGNIYMDNLDSPFKVADSILEKISCPNIFVDFHAEATSEKIALARYLSKRVSAVFGTHTHVQTADERILDDHTGFITDLGMCGASDSILGVKSEIIVNQFLTKLPARFETVEEGDRIINGCIFSVDEKTGKCLDIERINIR